MNIDLARTLLTRCDSRSRANCLLQLEHKLPLKEWLMLIGEYWSLCDNNSSIVDYLFFESPISQMKGPIYDMMSEQEKQKLKSLPDTFDIYRGCYESLNEDGHSYSLSLETAKSFVSHIGYKRDGYKPMLRHGRVRKQNVIAFINSRNEQEIIIRTCDIIEDQYLDV